MGKNDVNQIADNVRVVHAGCGVNALSGLQSRINSMYCSLLVGLISAAHQTLLPWAINRSAHPAKFSLPHRIAHPGWSADTGT